MLFINAGFAKVVGAAVVPHGAIALQPTHPFGGNSTEKLWATALHKAYLDFGEWIQSLKLNFVFLSTPHGMADASHFGFYANSVAGGNADQTEGKFNYTNTTSVEVELERSITQGLFDRLQEEVNVTMLTAFAATEVFPLRWAEVIPFHFMLTGRRSRNNNTPVVIVSQPTKRYNQSLLMIPELEALGDNLWSVLESLEERVAVVVSGDLAHTHNASGPYGWSAAAEPFDVAAGKWANTINSSFLTEVAKRYVDEALSCGYTGMVMLSSLLDKCSSCWGSRVIGPYHPSYYGMMVATFPRQ